MKKQLLIILLALAATLNTVAQAPTVSITAYPSNTITCTNTLITLVAHCSSSGLGANTFTWAGTCGPTLYDQVIQINAGNCTYTLTGKDPVTGNTATASIQIYQDITPPPMPTVSPTSAALACGVSPVTFTGIPNGAGYDSKWIHPNSTVPLNGYTCTPGIPGNYAYEITSQTNGCKSQSQVVVTTNSGLAETTVIAVSNKKDITCSGCVTIQAQALISGGVGTPIMSWHNAAGTTTLSTSPTLSTCASGDYMLYIYNNLAPTCVNRIYFTIGTNTAAPTVSVVSSSHLICPNQTATLSAYGQQATYLWSSSGFGTPVTVTPSGTTNYTVTATNPANSCTNTAVLTQSVAACTGINTFEFESGFFNLYPNPNNGNFILNIESALENTELLIKDNLGREVHRQLVSYGANSIKTESLSKGIYFCSLIQQSKNVANLKFIKE